VYQTDDSHALKHSLLVMCLPSSFPSSPPNQTFTLHTVDCLCSTVVIYSRTKIICRSMHPPPHLPISHLPAISLTRPSAPSHAQKREAPLNDVYWGAIPCTLIVPLFLGTRLTCTVPIPGRGRSVEAEQADGRSFNSFCPPPCPCRERNVSDAQRSGKANLYLISLLN
jgi:hypothetical protein